MKDLESLLHQTDFSKYSNLQTQLAKRLFSGKETNKIIPAPFRALSDDDLVYVNAAAGLPPETPGLQTLQDKNKPIS